MTHDLPPQYFLLHCSLLRVHQYIRSTNNQLKHVCVMLFIFSQLVPIDILCFLLRASWSFHFKDFNFRKLLKTENYCQKKNSTQTWALHHSWHFVPVRSCSYQLRMKFFFWLWNVCGGYNAACGGFVSGCLQANITNSTARDSSVEELRCSVSRWSPSAVLTLSLFMSSHTFAFLLASSTLFDDEMMHFHHNATGLSWEKNDSHYYFKCSKMTRV